MKLLFLHVNQFHWWTRSPSEKHAFLARKHCAIVVQENAENHRRSIFGEA